MPSGKSVNHRLQDVFFELLYDRSLHGVASEEGLRDCERVLSHVTSVNPRVEKYLKQIIEYAAAERNLSTRIDWLLDEIEEAGGRSLNKQEQLLLGQEAEIEDWLLDQAEHFEERLKACGNGGEVLPIASYRADDTNQPTAPPRRKRSAKFKSAPS
jgi:hypothetical protein